eukprot:TRINITY_DN2637_c0_g1_i10.p1 TRINITY_DN2637_c0_g1~~TRINITY_DN2637_c0_g1_i10.p1  ORF type:complete len:651 (+),score=133.60 TRINITY_DN2637_c0_g1_i10:256-2208(+)
MEAAATVGWVLGAAEDTVAATAGVAGASQLAAEAVSASASVASAVVVAAPAAGRVAGSAPLLGAAGVVAPIAGAAAPQTPLFGPHFVLRSASHLIYMGVLVAILLQVVTHLSLLHTASPPSTAQAYRLARLLILHAAMYVATGILAFYFTPFALGHVPLVLRAALSVALYAVGAHPPMTPIAYAAAHTFLRVPVDWLGTALAPHVGEVEDALATALTAYATARQSAKAAALAALAALADLDEDSGGGDVADAGGGGRPDGAAAGLDDGTAASTDGVTRRGVQPPLEAGHYVEATPEWTTEAAVEEAGRTKSTSAGRGGAAESDGWADADVDDLHRPLGESPAARMRRRSLRRATAASTGRSSLPGLLSGGLGDGGVGERPSRLGGAVSSTRRLGDAGASSSRLGGAGDSFGWLGGAGDSSSLLGGASSNAGVSPRTTAGTARRLPTRRLTTSSSAAVASALGASDLLPLVSSSAGVAAAAAAGDRRRTGGAGSSSASIAAALDTPARRSWLHPSASSTRVGADVGGGPVLQPRVGGGAGGAAADGRGHASGSRSSTQLGALLRGDDSNRSHSVSDLGAALRGGVPRPPGDVSTADVGADDGKTGCAATPRDSARPSWRTLVPFGWCHRRPPAGGWWQRWWRRGAAAAEPP